MTRLLVIRLSALGDVIHTIPAVALLRGEIAWVVEQPYAELVQVVAGVRAIPVRLRKWSLAEIRSAYRAVRGFETAVDFQGLIKSALIGRASGAGERYGFDRAAVREKPAAMFYTHKVSPDQSRHVVDWNVDLAKAITVNRQPSTVNWSAFPRPTAELEKYIRRIVFLPGAGRLEKQWPVENFHEVARRVGDRGGPLAVWGPDERDLAAATGAEMAPSTDLRQLAFVLQQAAVVVGGDTGPLHLAAALGTPVVGLYGPTDPKRNGPYGQLDSCISEFGRSGSMAAIMPDAVMKKIEEVTR